MHRGGAVGSLEWTRSVTGGNLVLHGRRVVGGRAAGEAVVTRQTISGWGGVDPSDGTVIETRHELCGCSFKGKVLVFPGAKGSSGWSSIFHLTRLLGTAPVALVFSRMTAKIALGATVMRVPSVIVLDEDPTQIIRTGDWVVVEGDGGIVEVHRAEMSV